MKNEPPEELPTLAIIPKVEIPTSPAPSMETADNGVGSPCQVDSKEIVTHLDQKPLGGTTMVNVKLEATSPPQSVTGVSTSGVVNLNNLNKICFANPFDQHKQHVTEGTLGPIARTIKVEPPEESPPLKELFVATPKVEIPTSSAPLMEVIDNAGGTSQQVDSKEAEIPTPVNQLRTQPSVASGPFHCSQCNRYFLKQRGLTQHNNSYHSGTKDHKCEVCGKKFAESQERDVHRKRHQMVNKSFPCPHEGCDRKYHLRYDLNRHVREAHGIKKFQCSFCSKPFERKDHLFTHENAHRKQLGVPLRVVPISNNDTNKKLKNTNGKTIKAKKKRITAKKKASKPKKSTVSPIDLYCIECDRYFQSTTGIRQHKNTYHSGIKAHRCNICGKKFDRSEERDLHRDRHRMINKSYSCPYQECQRKYVRRSDLNRHVREAHDGTAKYGCSLCSKRFEREDQLIVHEMNHNKKPTEDTLTENTATSDVLYHSSTNINQNPTSFGLKVLAALTRQKPKITENSICTQCDRTFENKRGLQQHINVHHAKVEEHRCDDCGKKFGTAEARDQHREHHRTINKPFACPYEDCDRKYRKLYGLKRHIKTFHGIARYGCKFCHKQFDKIDQVSKHEASHAKNTVIKSEENEQ